MYHGQHSSIKDGIYFDLLYNTRVKSSWELNILRSRGDGPVAVHPQNQAIIILTRVRTLVPHRSATTFSELVLLPTRLPRHRRMMPINWDWFCCFFKSSWRRVLLVYLPGRSSEHWHSSSVMKDCNSSHCWLKSGEGITGHFGTEKIGVIKVNYSNKDHTKRDVRYTCVDVCVNVQIKSV